MIWPQIMLIALWALGILHAAEKHGKPGSQIDVRSTILAVGIVATILYFGGFWNPLIGG